MEENLRRSLLISDGSWSFLWDRPLTLGIMSIIILIIGWQIYNSFFKKNYNLT
jgi:putative tricarboxylic transport membrane protein